MADNEAMTFSFEESDDNLDAPIEAKEKKETKVEEPKVDPDKEKEQEVAEPIDIIGKDTEDAPNEDIVIDSEKENKTEYASIASQILGEDFTLLIEGDDGDVEVPLAEANLSGEDFISVIKDYISEEKKGYKEKSVSLDGLDDTTVSIMKALKNSKGNFDGVSKLMNLQEQYVDPIKGLDLDKESDQVRAIKMRYEADDRFDNDTIDDIITAAKAKGELQARAEKSMNEMSKVVKQEAEKLIKQQEADEKELTKRLKTYRSTLESDLTERFSLEKSLAKKVADFAGKEVLDKKQNVRKFEIDTMYMQARQDKDIAPELALFLYDGGKTYNKHIESKLKHKVGTETQRALKLNRTTKPTSGGKRAGEKEEGLSFEQFGIKL